MAKGHRTNSISQAVTTVPELRKARGQPLNEDAKERLDNLQDDIIDLMIADIQVIKENFAFNRQEFMANRSKMVGLSDSHSSRLVKYTNIINGVRNQAAGISGYNQVLVQVNAVDATGAPVVAAPAKNLMEMPKEELEALLGPQKAKWAKAAEPDDE
jgi:hypothetical protein